MFNKERYIEVFNRLPENVTAAEACAVSHDEMSAHIKDGVLANGSSFMTSTISVLASNGNSVGRVVSSNLEDDPLTLINQAAENASHVSGGKNISITSGGPAINVKGTRSNASIDYLLAFGTRLEKAALAHPDVCEVTNCSVRMRYMAYTMVNSAGADSCFEEESFIAGIGVKIKSGTGKPARSGMSFQLKSLGDADPVALAARVAEKAKLVHTDLPHISLSSGIRDVTLLGDVASSIMVISWMGIVGAHFGKKSAIYPFDPGTVISYEKTTPETWANNVRESDGRGRYENGAIYYALNGSSPMQMVSVPSKLYIKPSEKGLSGLLTQMRNGLFVTEAHDVIHSVAPSNGDFSIICDGIVYEDGLPVGAFKRMVMHGNIQELLRNAADCADDAGHHEFMQKSYAYGSPSLLVRNMSFAGSK